MIQTSFIVPLRDNEGRPLRRSVHTQLRTRLVDAFGGFTSSPCEGEWRDASGQVYRDASLRYEIALASWEQVPDLLEVLRWLSEAARQLELFYTVAGIPEIMKGPRP